ncbi:MAG: hypothetical protein H7305_05620 [Gemmatimonadaceae bacterium]|nr:hypothetical protein [Gemmatimonadaceae bacterium]
MRPLVTVRTRESRALRRLLQICAMLALALPLAAQAPVPAGVGAGTAQASAQSSAKRDSITRQAQLSYQREVFAYGAGGRRDPFVSLASTDVLRPTIADLQLVGIAYSPRGNGGGVQSVAIFRDRQTKEQYRTRVGQQLGRMRVASIEPRRVVFSMDEFGVSRRESIAMGDSSRTITPTRAP